MSIVMKRASLRWAQRIGGKADMGEKWGRRKRGKTSPKCSRPLGNTYLCLSSLCRALHRMSMPCSVFLCVFVTLWVCVVCVCLCHAHTNTNTHAPLHIQARPDIVSEVCGVVYRLLLRVEGNATSSPIAPPRLVQVVRRTHKKQMQWAQHVLCTCVARGTGHVHLRLSECYPSIPKLSSRSRRSH